MSVSIESFASTTASTSGGGVAGSGTEGSRGSVDFGGRPARTTVTVFATPSPRFWWPWNPTWASSPSSVTSTATRSVTSSGTITPAESTTYTHWRPGVAMIHACATSASGVTVWLVVRSRRSRPRPRG